MMKIQHGWTLMRNLCLPLRRTRFLLFSLSRYFRAGLSRPSASRLVRAWSDRWHRPATFVRTCGWSAISWAAAGVVLLVLPGAAMAVRCPGNPATVKPNDNLQALVSACPAGTTFNLAAGVHHDSVTQLKNNDVFAGESGAIESGARQITGWTQVSVNGGSYWTAPGGTPLHNDPSNAAHCQANYPACWYAQDLFVDNKDYVHAASLNNLSAGTWYYDFDGSDGGTPNNVYLADDPTGHDVELAVLPFAFFSATASGITVQNLTIEKYAPNIQEGAVEPRAPGWVIQNCDIRLNHGSGISIRPSGNNIRVLNNSLHDNGQFGINVGAVNNVTVDGNDIFHNNIDHVKTGFGSGCCKFTGRNFMISNNKVHDNLGMGLWSDVFASGITYDHNVVYNNSGEGIRVEISDRNTITNNIVYGNGFGDPDEGGQKGPQIHCASSSHATITGNIITVSPGSAGGIVVDYNARREGCGPGCKVPEEMNISGNRITVLAPNLSAVEVKDYSNSFHQWGKDSMFDGNTYCMPNGGKPQMRFGDGNPPPAISFKDWQHRRQDPNGQVSQNASDCSSGG